MQVRLHIAYKEVTVAADGGFPKCEITITPGTGNPSTSGLRVGNTILISDASTGLVTIKALITKLENPNGYVVKAEIYNAAGTTGATGGIPDALLSPNSCNLFVYGSEFPKGSNGMSGAIEPGVTTFTNSPIILKDNYELSGSDAAQIGWIEVATEDGQSGYLWYLKAEGETRSRFTDYLEMAMIEGVPAEAASGVAALSASGQLGNQGTKGLFHEIENNGNVWSAGNPSTLADFDATAKHSLVAV